MCDNLNYIEIMLFMGVTSPAQPIITAEAQQNHFLHANAQVSQFKIETKNLHCFQLNNRKSPFDDYERVLYNLIELFTFRPQSYEEEEYYIVSYFDTF